jgi:very-short-patch-repair endonuclease
MTWPGWEQFDPAAHAEAQRAEDAPRPKRRRGKAGPSKLEAALDQQIQLLQLPQPKREVRLVPGRQFRWDRVWRVQRLAVEIQGGTWKQGAHSRGAGQARDAKKQALATLAGWRCLSVTADQIRSGEAVAWIEQALQAPQEG